MTTETKFVEVISKAEVAKQVAKALNTTQHITRIDKHGKTTSIPVDPIGDRQMISAREAWLFCVGKGKPINWIESYKALLKYVSDDYKYIFNPIAVGTNSGTRYHVHVSSIVEFLYRFQNNDLKLKKGEKK